MPNWATTRYEVKGPHDQIMGFAKLLMDSYKDGKKNPHKSVGFDASWLGYILRYAGLINNDDIENNNISIGCRGYISSYDDMEDFIYNYKDGDTLSFSTEWAWDMNPSFWRAILNKFWLGITIILSTSLIKFSRAASAFSILFLPSNAKGFVTTPTVKIPFSLAILATTGAAPEPVPPPIPAVIKTILESANSFSISSLASSAAILPISGLAPAPKP